MRVRLVWALCVAAPMWAQSGRHAPLNAAERAAHVLDRFAFGARPGDIGAVETMGPEQWFEAQLQPDAIGDGKLDARLGPLRAVRMSAVEMMASYPPNQLLQQVDQGKQPMPTDPQSAAVYATLIDRMHEQERQNKATVPTDAEREAMQKQLAQDALRSAVPLLLMHADDRYTAILAMPVADRRTMLEHLRGDLRDKLYEGFNGAQREFLAVMQYGSGVAQTELQEAKLLRAVYSERQLLEVMTDFWFNHFNVFLDKDSEKYYAAAYERDVIRRHALGKFKDLLLAVAHSPAMLVYLDNASSIGPNSTAGLKSKRGLNENYGRELLELHTLGVNGGYSQQDVTEAARVLTGWTVDHPEKGGGFVFDRNRHEPGEKRVLGRVYRNDDNPQQEGVDLLDDLAHRPATARFICTKLARRFVADNPPQPIVDAMVKTFEQSGGDIREVLRTMVHSPQFWTREVYRAKFKTPFEFVASAMRASAVDIKNPQPLTAEIGRMGEPLYRMQPPTGYSTLAADWLGTNALLERLNFAIKLTSNGFGVDFDGRDTLAAEVMGRTAQDAPLKGDGVSESVALLQESIVGTDISPQTTAALRTAVSATAGSDTKSMLNGIIGLLIGAPEFQRR